MTQDKCIKKYILQHKGLIVIPRILREAIRNSKMNPRPNIGQIKRVMVEILTENIVLMLKDQSQGLLRCFFWMLRN